jgi:AbrB family looped-hinge helix DNA binding protein
MPVEFLTLRPYHWGMKATLTSKGQITIPIAIREKLGLRPGDQIEFDENATILVGRRVVNPAEWSETLADWRHAAGEALAGHPWSDVSVAELIDDLRGGPADSAAAVSGSQP